MPSYRQTRHLFATDKPCLPLPHVYVTAAKPDSLTQNISNCHDNDMTLLMHSHNFFKCCQFLRASNIATSISGNIIHSNNNDLRQEGYVFVYVCLFVSRITQTLPGTFMKLGEEV